MIIFYTFSLPLLYFVSIYYVHNNPLCMNSLYFCTFPAGSALLEHSLKTAAVDPRIKEAYLHVQTSNTETIEWYSHRGFKAVETIKDYYKRIECCDAVVLRRELTPPPPHVHQHGGGCCGHSH